MALPVVEQSDAPGTPDSKSDARDVRPHSEAAQGSLSDVQGTPDSKSDARDEHHLEVTVGRLDAPVLAEVIQSDVLDKLDNRLATQHEHHLVVQSANRLDAQAHNRIPVGANISDAPGLAEESQSDVQDKLEYILGAQDALHPVEA